MKRRIGSLEEVGLIFCAIFFDMLSLIPLLGDITTFMAQALLAFFFALSGVNVVGKRTWFIFLFTFVSELFPLTSWLPMLTVETIFIIMASRAEDKLKAKSASV
jgi:signal transduction histidine kinase